jgi:hypothetical protein
MASEHRQKPPRQALASAALLAALALGGSVTACEGNLVPHEAAANPAELPAPLPPVISPRAERLPNYPCMQCHDKIVAQQGEVTVPIKSAHREIKFAHFQGITECSLCHDSKNMNDLRLLTGQAVPIDEAFRVCGGCHGIKARDWESGAHGKQVGSWQREGVKNRYNCTDCHNPHAPAFPQMHAKPPPPVPKFNIPKGGVH